MKKTFIFLSILTLFLFGCTNEEETDETVGKTYVFDPRVPGGSIADGGDTIGGALMNLQAVTTKLNEISFTWTVPPLYKTLDYKVYIFKRSAIDPAFVLPNPTEEGGAAIAELFRRVTLVPVYDPVKKEAESFIDGGYYCPVNEGHERVDYIPPLDTCPNGESPRINQGQDYTYWFYLSVNIDGKEMFSKAQKLELQSGVTDNSFEFPDPSKFWENLSFTIGPPIMSDIISQSTIGPFQPIDDEANRVKDGARIAVGLSGTVMYYADTPHNRVIIFTKGQAHSCNQWKESDRTMYYACLYQYAGLPFTATGVIGQEANGNNKESSEGYINGRKTCAQHNEVCNSRTQLECDPNVQGNGAICTWDQKANICSANARCLTAPKKVKIVDDQLFIFDGNDRIVVYKTNDELGLPIKGHVPELFEPSPRDGGPAFVIGKKSLFDLDSYPIGQSSLNNPSDVVSDGSNLFISDTDNNRVVSISDYKTKYRCNGDDNNWGNLPTDAGYNTGECKFSYVLGQESFFQKWDLKTNPNGVEELVNYYGYCNTLDQNSCATNESCHWISSESQNRCDLKPNLVDQNILKKLNSNRPGEFLARYFRKPTELFLTSFRDNNGILDTYFGVLANEDLEFNSPTGLKNQLKSRILLWRGIPLSGKAPIPLGSDFCYSTNSLMPNSTDSNFSISGSRCHADFVIGQRTFDSLFTNSPAVKYGKDNDIRQLNDISSLFVNGRSLLGVDRAFGQILYWDDFLKNIGTTSTGSYPLYRIENPNGAVNTKNGTFLPKLKEVTDIQIGDGNIIYISDPNNNKIYEIRAPFNTNQ